MIYKLSEIANITMGQSPSSKNFNKNKIGLPFLQGNTTFTNKYPYFDKWTKKWKKEAHKGDILFTVRAPVGELNIAKNTIAIGRGIASIKPLKTSTEYLYYLLHSNKKKFLASSSGTIFSSINKNILENITLKIHANTEQQHIVDIIGSIDEKIILNSEIAKKLYEIIHYVYLSSNDETIKLGNISTIKTGRENASNSSLNGIYKFFTCSDQPLNCDNYKFNCEAILLAGNGTFSVNHYNGKFNAYQRTYVITPNHHNDYGLTYISIKSHIKNLIKNCSGSIIKFIGINDVINIQVKNISEIKKKFITYLLSKIDFLNIENDELKKYKNITLPLMLGEQIY